MPSTFVEVAKELIEQDYTVIDEFIKESIEPIADVGSPAKLIGKPYTDWTPADLNQAVAIYGPASKVLEQYIAREQINQMHAYEEAVANL